jgi:O-antigen ligase
MPSDRRHLLEVVVGALLVAFIIFSTFSIAISQWSYILASAIWLVGVWWTTSVRQARWPLVWSLSAFFVASMLSAVLAANQGLAFRELSSEWARMLLFLACVNHLTTEKRATRFVSLLVAVCTLSALYGLSQTLTMGTEYRIHGTLSHYMTFAGLMMQVALLAAAQLLYNWRSKRDVWLLACLIVIVAALAMTHTRSAWIGLLIGLVVLALGKKRLLLGIPVVALLLVVIAPRAVRDRALSMLDIRDPTAVERTYMWGSGVRLFMDYPLTGVGPDNLRSVYPSYKHPDDPWQPHIRFTHLHNNVIQVAAERGILGLGAWLGIWIAFYTYAARIFKRSDPPDGAVRALASGSVAAVSAFLVAGLLEYNFGDSEVISLVFFNMALLFVPKGGGLSPRGAPSGQTG